MRITPLGSLVIGVAALLAAGCASSNEWATWMNHPTHFASGQHAGFSMRNGSDAKARVTRNDVALARAEGWWGKPVTVSSEQILDR
jgi:hypothetical protein